MGGTRGPRGLHCTEIRGRRWGDTSCGNPRMEPGGSRGIHHTKTHENKQISKASRSFIPGFALLLESPRNLWSRGARQTVRLGGKARQTGNERVCDQPEPAGVARSRPVVAWVPEVSTSVGTNISLDTPRTATSPSSSSAGVYL